MANKKVNLDVDDNEEHEEDDKGKDEGKDDKDAKEVKIEKLKLRVLKTCPPSVKTDDEDIVCPRPDLWRFSKTDNEKDAPYFDLFRKRPDPISQAQLPTCKCKVKKPKKRPIHESKDMKKKTKDDDKCKKKGYVAPKYKKWVEDDRERHKKEKGKFYFCHRELIKVESPLDLRRADLRGLDDFQSLVDCADEIQPEKTSLTESMFKCVKVDRAELKLKIPKSTIFINRKKDDKKDKDGDGKGEKKEKRKHKDPVDSFDFIYNPPYRKQHKEFEIFRADDKVSQISVASEVFDDEEIRVIDYDKGTIEDQGEGEYYGQAEDSRKEDIEGLEGAMSVLIKSNQRITTSVSDLEFEGEEGVNAVRKPVKSAYSLHSAYTEIDSDYKLKDPVDSSYEVVAPIVTKMVQKYRRDSETGLPPKEKLEPQRGTLQSHSQTKVKIEPTAFFYGSQIGTLHQGSPYFSDKSRNRQGLANCVTAYVYSFIKPPNRWTPLDIDKVLETGDRLYLTTIDKNHLHTNRVLKPKELYDIVNLDDIKIKYKIHDPDIAGITKSEDPKIFDLLKGLVLFFDRYRAGILQTLNTNILIWKRKHYFVFDPTPRDTNLYMDDTGAAILANFYDIQSIMIMLERGNLENSPFIISRISVKKIIRDDEDERADGDSIGSELRKDSEYKIISSTKAVVCGKLHVGDKCFETCKSQQVLCVVLMSLIYYHITPAAAWHSKTLDKFLIIGNQFYRECLKEMNTDEFKLENIPAFFTIGPLTIELSIYANQHAGFMYKKGMCFFEEMLRKFFQKHTTALIEIDRYVIGIWKQRMYFYMFDPYSRGIDALKAANGGACVSMNGSLRSMVETITHNFEQKEYIFKIHALKLLKLNRDPEYAENQLQLVDSEMDIMNSIRVGNKRAMNQVKPISVDISEKAVKTITQADVSLGPSDIEVASGIESIDQKFVADLPVKCVKPTLIIRPPTPDVVYDLESPSLSETQIEQPRPDPEIGDEGMALKHLEQLEKEQLEFEKILEMPGEGYEDITEFESGEISPVEEFDEEEYVKDIAIQKGKDPGIGRESAEMNTDLLGICPLPRILLEPTDMSKAIKAKRHAMRLLLQPRIEPPVEVIDTTQELQRKSNFETLPDGSYIIYGTINVANIEPSEFEDVHPYCSVMAIAMMRKYSLHTWTHEVVDSILVCGHKIYKGINVNFSTFRQIEIPQIAIGSSNYSICIQHVFDSLLDRVILESALEKILLKRYCMGVIACKIFSCAVFVKRGVYYMFDSFGNNKVGLGEGPGNSGVACLFRFKSLSEVIARFMYNKTQREIVEPTEATRFVMSAVKVTNVFMDLPIVKRDTRRILEEEFQKQMGEDDEIEGEERDDKKDEPKPKNVIGYIKRDKYYVLRGSKGLKNRMEITGDVKVCHFVCTCAMLGLLCKPINRWTRKRVNYIFESGVNLFSFIDNMNFADKRSIKNLLIDDYFFDIIIKRIQLINPENCRTNVTALKFILNCKHKYLLLQYLNCCFVLYKTNQYYHLFDPYGLYTTAKDEENRNNEEEAEEEEDDVDDEKDKGKATWVRFKTMKKLQAYLRENTTNGDCFHFTVHISNLRKATKWRRLGYKLRIERSKKKRLNKEKLKKLNENENWLEIYPIPWSRMTKNLASGKKRDPKLYKWYNWDIEYPKDLFSLIGVLHQTSKGFSRISRGKQTIANCIVAIIMTEMYSFQNWNSSVLSSILRAGDVYFKDSIQNISDENYELKLEDFKKELVVNPYNVKIKYTPYCEGTMFVVRPKQYNLSKALRCFFEAYENRNGIIACTREGSKTKFLAFGRVQFGEYYMYDCQTVGPPMFLDKFRSASYILRCLSLNRLLYIMTLTLRGGDFFIYEVKIVPPNEPTEDSDDQEDYGG